MVANLLMSEAVLSSLIVQIRNASKRRTQLPFSLSHLGNRVAVVGLC